MSFGVGAVGSVVAVVVGAAIEPLYRCRLVGVFVDRTGPLSRIRVVAGWDKARMNPSSRVGKRSKPSKISQR